MKTLDQLLAGSAERFPTRIAIEEPDAGAISYAELNAAADEVARALAAAGVLPGDRVGIVAPKSISTVASILGVLRAGACYVPVDAMAPLERGAGILGDCTVRAVITTDALAAGLRRTMPLAAEATAEVAARGSATRLGLLPVESPRAQEPVVPGLAYILYTSGSTGKPKGVMHSHATASSFIDWCSSEFLPTEADRFSSHAPFHFDLSIFDLYLPLKHGATLVLIGEELGKQPQQLARLISERRISIWYWYSTPSILRLLLEYGKMERFEYPSLRVVCYAGEVFPVKFQRALRAVWPHPAYYNLYGPTETNVCTFDRVVEVPPEDHQGPLPIGVVCSGDRATVRDADGAPVPPGEEGELLVSGGSVMLGYWNLPKHNARVFVEDPDGTRWYKTGDVVVDRGDGCYLFLGRRDRMVKRRGYRVELGEIEAALHRHENIVEAGVIAVPDAQSGVLIKAYVVWQGTAQPSVIELKSFAATQLPAYMIPDRFVVLPALPKTSTDKLDYQKLREFA